ncbi:helix-turn-helix domain-containing protein, partial [Glaesserella parasuis]
MLKLKQVLIDKSVSLRQLAQKMNVSPATVSQLVNHNQRVKQQWAEFETNLARNLTALGITEPLRDLLKDEATGESLATEPAASAPKSKQEIKDEIMLLAKQALFPATKKHFGLFRDPFAEDI